MRRSKCLLSNLVLLVKPQFDVGWSPRFRLTGAFGFYSDTLIRTLQLEITQDWYRFP